MTSAVATEVIRDLSRGGVLRAGINVGNPALARRDPASGEIRGIAVDLARAFAARLGVGVALVTFDAAGKMFNALKSDAWDVAFMAIDPERATELAFTAPYQTIEGTYLVRADSPLAAVEDVDRPQVRIAVGNRSAYDLYLSRTIAHAQLVRASSPAESFEMFLQQNLEVLAGVRQVLLALERQHAGLRAMSGRFMTIEQAVATPKDRTAGAGFLSGLVEELKHSGFVTAALERMQGGG